MERGQNKIPTITMERRQNKIPTIAFWVDETGNKNLWDGEYWKDKVSQNG